MALSFVLLSTRKELPYTLVASLGEASRLVQARLPPSLHGASEAPVCRSPRTRTRPEAGPAAGASWRGDPVYTECTLAYIESTAETEVKMERGPLDVQAGGGRGAAAEQAHAG